MATVKLQEPRRPQRGGCALFALGFRPFFVLAGGFAALLILLWIPMFTGALPAPPAYGLIGWHQHEMIFGYAAALIGGFLLTAVGNWTGLPTPTGRPLAALAGLWLAARLLPFAGISGWPLASGHWLLAIIDVAYWPLLAGFLARPLLASKQRHNQAFLAILLAIGAADAAVHADRLGLWPDVADQATRVALGLVVVIMCTFGGRVIPLFTESGLGRVALRRFAWVERLAVPSVLLWVAALLLAPGWADLAALPAAVVHGSRLIGWHRAALWRVPLLWVLHLGYAWIVLGFILHALSATGLVAPSLAIHAFTAGGIGVLGLGMMSRVSLGHTGRQMQSARSIDVAFALVNAAVLLRVLGPLLLPAGYATFLSLSAICWAAAFGLFCLHYWPILWAPRVDGQPG